MAEINVERKERSIMPWVIGLLVLGLLVWAVLSYLNRGDDGEGAETVAPPAGAPVGGNP